LAPYLLVQAHATVRGGQVPLLPVWHEAPLGRALRLLRDLVLPQVALAPGMAEVPPGAHLLRPVGRQVLGVADVERQANRAHRLPGRLTILDRIAGDGQ